MSEVRRGACHCGAVEFEVQLPVGLAGLGRCNCSICRRKGAIMIGVPLDKLVVIRGEDKLTLYQWNTQVAKHYFCRICGIYTHHQRRSNPGEYGVNVGCLDGIDVAELGDIRTGNGAALSLVGNK